MATYKHQYSPVGLPSSTHNNNGGTEINRRSLSQMLLVTPAFYFLFDPLVQTLPPRLVAAIATPGRIWRKFMAVRPFCACCGPLGDMAVAHLLLCLPLAWWLYASSELALLRPTSHHALKHSGKLASYAMAAAFFTASKSHSLVSLVTGLSFERLVNFHLASALLTLWMSLLHGIQIAYYHRGSKSKEDHHHDDHKSHNEGHRNLHHDSIHTYLGPDPNLLEFFVDGKRNRSGFAVLVALILVVATSVFHRILRKWWFECWLLYHISGAIVVLAAGLIHGADIFIFVIVWWIWDVFIRNVIMVGVRNPNRAEVTTVAEDITKLQFDKGEFSYEAGQFVQVWIPSISLWEFHPFSIATTPEDPHVTLYIRALPGANTWTRNLYDKALPQREGETRARSVRVFLEGPYGSVAPIIERADKYSMAVLVSGGIGVTPCHSIARYLIGNPNNSQLRKIRYIWAIRDEGMVKAIPPPSIEDTGANGGHTSNYDNGIELVERGQEGQAAGQATEDYAIGHLARRPLVIQNEIYLTRKTKFLDDHQAGDNDVVEDKGIIVDHPSHAEEETDSYTIYRGRRPDVQAILNQVQTEAMSEGWGRVFVMGCGPISLLEELHAACRTHQTKEIQIDFHQEVFDY